MLAGVHLLHLRHLALQPAFTVSERVAIADAVAERLGQRHGGDRKSDQEGNISLLIETGRTRDIAAAKADPARAWRPRTVPEIFPERAS